MKPWVLTYWLLGERKKSAGYDYDYVEEVTIDAVVLIVVIVVVVVVAEVYYINTEA